MKEIKPGSCLTPDEMMFEWKGESGFGGLPLLSYIKRKPKPLGTELKSVCEGLWACVFLSRLKKGRWSWHVRNGVDSMGQRRHALSVFLSSLV